MQSVEALLAAAGNYRLKAQPQWVQKLVHDLATRMEAEHKHAEAVRRETDAEIAAARALLNEGPADSDTFLSLGGVIRADHESDDGDSRPLGRGVFVEFRPEGAEVGEGYAVRVVDGVLEISGPNRLAVEPINSTHVLIIPAPEAGA